MYDTILKVFRYTVFLSLYVLLFKFNLIGLCRDERVKDFVLCFMHRSKPLH